MLLKSYIAKANVVGITALCTGALVGKAMELISSDKDKNQVVAELVGRTVESTVRQNINVEYTSKYKRPN